MTKKPAGAARNGTGRRFPVPWPSPASQRQLALLVFGLALAVRLLYLADVSGSPTFGAPIIDSNYYDCSANELVRSGRFTDQFFFQPFLYPLFLAGVYLLSNSSMIWAKVVQALIGAAACALTYLLGERILDRKAALLAGLFAALYGPLIFFGGELLGTVLEAFCFVALLFLVLRAEKEGKAAFFLLLGAAMGLSILTRPTFLPACLALLLWLVYRLIRSRAGVKAVVLRAVATLMGISLILGPVAALFQRETGAMGFLPTSGGINFFIGNNPDYEKTMGIRPGMRFDRLACLPFREGVSIDGAWDRARYFYGKTVRFAREQPALFLLGLGKKTLELVSSREIPNNVDIYLFREWSSLLALLTWKIGPFGFPFGLLFPLAAWGAVALRRRIPTPLWLLLLLYAGSIILVHVNARYRLPLVPMLCVLGAGGFLDVVRLVKEGKTRALLASAGLLAGLIPVVTLPGPFVQERNNYRAETYALIGEYHMMRGRPAEAARALATALQYDPDSPGAHAALGAVLQRLGRDDEAASHYYEAVRLDREQFDALSNLGLVLSQRGRSEEAIVYLSDALNASPDERRKAETHVNLGLALARAGRTKEAESSYLEAIRLQPKMAEAYSNLGLLLSAQRRFPEAVAYYLKALDARPEHAQTHINAGAALVQMDRFEDAMDHYREALRIDPGSAAARYQAALAMETGGEGGRGRRAAALHPIVTEGCVRRHTGVSE